jgi:signal transduction histidine kinase
MERFEAAEVAGRIVDYVRDTGAAAPSRSRARLRWQEVDNLGEPPVGGVEAPAAFEAELRRLLRDALGADPVTWTSSREMDPAGDSQRRERRGPPQIVTVALRMGDGRLALAESPIYRPPLRLPPEVWGSMALTFVVTTLFSIYAGRLAVRPVSMLADAAERLSRNIAEPPLPERGAEEIRAAASAFNRMQDRLRRHVNGRAVAFAAMSHDIRTPLTRMRLRLESLGGDARAKLGRDLDLIETLAKSALELTRGLAADEPVTSVDVDAMVRRIAEDYDATPTPVAVQGGAQPVEGRPVALRRALANLVENAVKYGRDVCIQVADARDAVRILVLDRGPGIAAEHLEKVTIPFYRVEASRNRDTGGAGLGLAIARDIVEGHGGELLLANRPGGGLSATVRLPR